MSNREKKVPHPPASAEQPKPAAAPGRYMPEFDPDVAHGQQRDMLGIEREVNAMAALMAARDTKPPLSIGLFGDWGTGKTFFMEKIHAQIDRIAAARAPSFCTDIVQIRFNAWHYVEANLWASLVNTIFERLEESVMRRKDGDAQMAALRERWQSALLRQRRVEEELAALAQTLQRAEEERNRLIEQKQKAEEEMQRARAQREQDMPMIRDAMSREVGTLLSQLKRELGLSGLPEAVDMANRSIDEVVETLSDARLLQSRAQQAWRALLVGKFTVGQVVAAMITMLAPIAIAWVIARVSGESLREILAQPITVLSEIAVMIGTVTQWVRHKVRRASQVLDRVEDVRAKLIKERDAELAKRDLELESAQAKVAELSQALEQKQALLSELSAQQEEAKRELDEQSPARRIASFLTERAQSDDYRKHLGLIALIREDLEKLSRLLAMQDSAEPDPSLPSVQRIVLYIDDLDRCPPGRVVEVLQAIHLLLAFPLFAVVVAVDARWLSRALLVNYPELLEPDDEGGPQASAHDYLEKIFQVPFWLRPLDEAAGARMISGLLGGATEEEAATSMVDGESPIVLDASKLSIHHRERELMMELAGVAGRSPRALKRFVNVYRLIKAGLSDIELAVLEPDANGNGHYKAVLLALAVSIGYPRIADEMYEILLREPKHQPKESEEQQTAAELVTALAQRYRDSKDAPLWQALQKEVTELGHTYPVTRKELVECAGMVARFSFRVMPGS